MTSDIARCSHSQGKAFSKVANVKPVNQPGGCLKKAYNELKATYAPNNTMEIMMLKQDFANCAPKNGKTDPDVIGNYGLRYFR